MDKKRRILEALKMQPLSDEEKERRHILGRLYGPIATCTESTRNGRRYNRDLWEKALADEVFKEKVANKSLFLELGHPQDREETDMEKVCACIPELPQIVDGDLYAYVDILDTNNGRLLKTLCDYGFVPGISSRGSGDIMPNDEVDPETFFLETWDIVQLPAVKKARLAVCESLEPQRKEALERALVESYSKKSKEEQKEMKEALENLNLNVDLSEGRKKKAKKDSANFLPNGTPKDLGEIPWSKADDNNAEKLLMEDEGEEAEAEPIKDDSIDFDIVAADETDVEDKDNKSEEVETEEEDSEVKEDEKELSVTTVGDFVNMLSDFDESSELVFNPITIDGKTYEEVQYTITNTDEDNKVYIDMVYADSDSLKNDSASEDEADDSIEQPKDIEETEVLDDEETVEDSKSDDEAKEDDKAIDDGLDDILENLKDLVRSKELLEAEVKSLKKTKAVSDAKVDSLVKETQRYKESFDRASVLAAKATSLNKKVEQLTEAINLKDNQISELQSKVAKAGKLNESLENNANKVKQLTEELANVKADANKKAEDLQKQLNESRKLTNERTGIAKRYKERYEAVLEHYVDSKAKMLGVPSSRILESLGANYTVDDVDKVCEDLLTSSVNMGRLPFNTNTRIKTVESVRPQVRKTVDPDHGYEIDDSLLELAGLKD